MLIFIVLFNYNVKLLKKAVYFHFEFLYALKLVNRIL